MWAVLSARVDSRCKKRNEKHLKKVGITGGIGCGKSTVVAEFERLGVPCFVADKVAGAYYGDAAFLAEVRRLMGDGVFRADGSADKRAIASRVFADAALLDGLNALVHPRVMSDFDQYCRRHSGADYVLFESAILYEHGLDRAMDSVVCVYLDPAERLRRLLLRDGGDEAAIRARMASQQPAEVALMEADYVILNYEGNPRRRQVAYVDRCLRREVLQGGC